MQKHPMTVKGADALKKELHRLKSIERPRIIEAIATARAHGDLKENAEYHAAREQQGFIEGRIRELEAKLSFAQIIDITKMPNQGRVIFGATIHLVHIETQETVKYQIVGEDEADLKIGKISVSSPVARALVSKQEGDTVVVKLPSGVAEYEISQVEYLG